MQGFCPEKNQRDETIHLLQELKDEFENDRIFKEDEFKKYEKQIDLLIEILQLVKA